MGTGVSDRVGATSSVSTWAADLVAAGLGVWLVGGVYLDGWAHLHRPGMESFFTPWHAVLYSGFAALAGWLTVVAARARRAGVPPAGWVPAGYGLGLAGVAVFVAGGLGDMIWHQVFGVEVGLDALLSPTHLVLLVGGVLMLSTSLRAAAGRPADRRMLPAMLAVAATAALAAFFLSYLSVFADAAAAVAPTEIPEGAPGHRQAENFTVVGLGEYLGTTGVLVVAVLYTLRRIGRLPAGLITAVVAAVAAGGGVLTEFAHPAALLGAVLGGVAADVLVQAVAARTRRHAAVVVGLALPALVWPGQLAGLAVDGAVAWSVELWAGVVVVTALAGAVLGSLLSARDVPADRSTA